MFEHNIGLEALAASVALLLALAYPQLANSWFLRAEMSLARIARKRRLSVIFCGLAALAMRLAILPWVHIPYPYVNDEFSFLLAADTFSHGRLANPTPPMWIHLETFHVIFHPTYSSMYPPLQGLALAFGQVVLGHPFWGVWLSVGLMCSAICWMLQAWLPPSWALLGGLLPVLRFGVFSYWDNSYWGGALATTGGALLLGALPRITRRHLPHHAVIMALGVAMLANTRPYEGLILVAAVGVCTIFLLAKEDVPRTVWLRQLILPACLFLAIAGAATSYYCWKVTGSPLEMPQQLNRETYAVARYFYWQTAYPSHKYRHKEISDFYALEVQEFERSKSLKGVVSQTAKKIGMVWVFYLSPLLTLPLFWLPAVFRDRRLRVLMAVGLIGFIGSVLVVFFNMHYIAPIASIIITIVVQCMRHMRVYRFEGRPVGLFLVRAIVVAAVLLLPVQVRILASVPEPGDFAAIAPNRAAIEANLRALPQPQLVLVRYGPHHDPLMDWVYNGADIDHQKTIWARDMGVAQNEELLSYYKDRRVWMLDADASAPRLAPYAIQTPSKPDLTNATPVSRASYHGGNSSDQKTKAPQSRRRR